MLSVIPAAHTVLILPGLGNSGPGHWQSIWSERRSDAQRVEQRDWDQPNLIDWLNGLHEACSAAPGRIVLVAHSLACILVAHAAQRIVPRAGFIEKVSTALLVAPADVDFPSHTPEQIRGFGPIPLNPLPFPSIVVTSRNDPYMSHQRGQFLARRWGARCVDAGIAGHINHASGHGDWPDGERLLDELIAHHIDAAGATASSSRLMLT